MSHSKKRKDSNCLNCGAVVERRFCPECGQENLEPGHSFFHFALHFFSDLFHFDSKLFITLRYLLTKPGFLTKEYLEGKRKKYNDPIKMYIFISAVSLIYLLWILHFAEFVNVKQHPEYARAVDSARAELGKKNFVFDFIQLEGEDALIFSVPENMRQGQQYFEQQNPEFRNEGLLTRYLYSQAIKMYESYDASPYNFFPEVINKWLHSFSKIFFISLPFFIFLLSLLFFRKRKILKGGSHSVFTLHYYCFCFILLTLIITISNLFEDFSFSGTLDSFLFFGGLVIGFVYLFEAMRRFYREGYLSVFFKSLILYALNGFMIFALLIFFFFSSFMDVH